MKNFYYFKCLPFVLIILGTFVNLRSQSLPSVSYINPIDIDSRQINTSLYVGAIAGSADITPIGGASYTIPIILPPGTAGMVPQLAVVYNSQSGNGQLGLSFDLAGLSSISRVSKSLYYDGYTGGVELDTTDRFAIDGQRLMKVSGTYYGANNSEYKTEVESFSRIKSYEISGLGPKWFKVETKDGKIIEYGNTSDSRIVVSGTQTVYLWRINKISDGNGNYIRFHYANDTDGDSRIIKIEYTGNHLIGLDPYNTIEFNYGIRGDKVDYFIKGKKLNQKTLLTSVIVKSENQTSRIYGFAYSFIESQSRLIKVSELSGDMTVKNSTEIDWGKIHSGNYNFISLNTMYMHKYFVPVDVNNDGKQDLLLITKNSTDGSWNQWHLYINNNDLNGRRSGSFIKINSGPLPGKFKAVVIADVNQDGVDDILFQVEETINYECNHRPCDGSGGEEMQWDPDFSDSDITQPPPKILNEPDVCYDICSYTTTKLLFYQFHHSSGIVRGSSSFDIDFNSDKLTIQTGDFNGDGKTDFLAIDENKNYRGIRGFSAGSMNFNTPNDVFVVDMDGDGKNEIFVRKGMQYMIFQYNNSTKSIELKHEATFSIWAGGIKIGDFNGDGKTDFYVQNISLLDMGWYIFYSNGQSLETPIRPINSYFSSSSFFLKDLNGDRKVDIVRISKRDNSSVNIAVYYSNGYGGFLSPETNSHSVRIEDIRDINFLDLWGEGKTSLAISSITNYVGFLSFKRGEQKNLVMSILNGFNIKYSFEYTTLPVANISTYQKGYGAVFPVIDAVIPLNVVKSMKASHPLEGEFLHHKYYYEGLKLHIQGKGLLGYTKVVVDDVISGFRSVSEYDYETTFFSVSLKRQTQGLTFGALTSETSFTNNVKILGNKRFLPYVSQSVTKDWINNNTTTTSFQYDDYANPLNITQSYNDGASVVTNNSYIAAGGWGIPNRIKETTVTNHLPGQPSFSRKKLLSYDSKGNLLTEISDPGKAKAITSTFTNNLVGLPIRIEIAASGLESRYTEHEYDSEFRFVVKTRNSLSQEFEKSYDPKTGNVIWEKAINGNESTYNYDGFGRLVSTVTPKNNTISQSVTWNSSLAKSLYMVTTTPPIGRQTKAFYDALGREIMTETPGFDAWVRTTRTYNNKGQLLTSTQPHFVGETAKINTYAYDVFGRPVSQNNNGLVSSFSYAPNKTTITNPAGRVSSKETNARGQLITATDQGGAIHYEYHSNGQPKRISALGSVTEMNYDDYGMQTELSEPNAGSVNYSYNAYGELVSQTDANGNAFNMIYDRLGRTMSKTSPEGTTAYQYISSGNGTGQLGSVTAPGNISETFEYNVYGDLLKITESIDGQIFTTSFEYDPYGRNNKIIYPSGTFVTNNYNPWGYLDGSSTNGPGSNHLAYVLKNANAFDQPLLVESYLDMGIWPPLRTTYTYDGFNLPENVKTFSNKTIQDDRYVFDSYTGNLQSRENKLKNLIESFTYDNLNRLTEVSNPASPMNLAYQPNGNILNKTGVGDYAYDAQKLHAVTSVTNSHGIIPETVQDITYTSFNKTAVIEEGNKKLVFTYGPDNERKKSELYENDILVTTRYYVGSYEKVITNGVTREVIYLSGPTGPHGVRISDDSQNATAYYFLKDHLGSITGLVNMDGNIEQYLSYDAWGRRRNPNDWSYNNVAQNFLTDRGYTSHEHHDAFGLINMNGRMYDPILGRVLSPDNFVQLPDFSQNFNRYSYVWNNPLVYTDPDGEFIFTFLLAPIGLAPVGVLLDGACWSAAIDAGIQGIRIASGAQDKFNWAELGGSAVGGLVFAGMGLIAPSFSVTSTIFMTNLPKYAGKAGYAALTAAASTGAGMFASDMFDNGKIDYSGEDYLKAMGTAGLISGAFSFASSMYDYATWDRLSTPDKMTKIQNRFGSNVKYDSRTIDYGYYNAGDPDVYLGLAALDNQGLAFSTARHELKHLSDWNKYTAGSLRIPARRGTGYAGFLDHTEIRAHKLEMRYFRNTSKFYLDRNYFLRYFYRYNGLFFAPNPFMYFNAIF